MGRGIEGTPRNLYPEAWEEYITFLPPEDREDPNVAYYRLLTSDDFATRLAAAKAWNKWELGISQLVPDENVYDHLEDDTWYDNSTSSVLMM